MAAPDALERPTPDVTVQADGPDTPDIPARAADDAVVMPGHADERPRRRRLLGPVATGLGVSGALGYLAVVDPNEPGHYPLCPTQALFSVDCPGCGLMRGTHDLITGDVPRALDHNVLIVILLPLVVVLWLGWLRRAWTGWTPAVTARQFRRRNVITIAALVVLIAFGVVRNFVPYLGSGIG